MGFWGQKGGLKISIPLYTRVFSPEGLKFCAKRGRFSLFSHRRLWAHIFFRGVKCDKRAHGVYSAWRIKRGAQGWEAPKGEKRGPSKGVYLGEPPGC